MNRQQAAAAGVPAGAYFTLSILVLGAVTPGYDPLAQFVSELGAEGMPGAWRLNWLTLVPVALLIAMSGIGRFMLEERWSGLALVLTGVGYLLAGLNRCDAGCSFEAMSREAVVHNQAAFAAFALGLLASVAVAAGAAVGGRWGRAGTGLLGASAMGAGLFLLMTLGLDHSLIGAAQRLFLFAFSLWLAVDSYALARNAVAAR